VQVTFPVTINTAGQVVLSVAMQQQCCLLFGTQYGNTTISVYKVRIESDGPHTIIICNNKILKTDFGQVVPHMAHSSLLKVTVTVLPEVAPQL